MRVFQLLLFLYARAGLGWVGAGLEVLFWARFTVSVGFRFRLGSVLGVFGLRFVKGG